VTGEVADDEGAGDVDEAVIVTSPNWQMAPDPSISAVQELSVYWIALLTIAKLTQSLLFGVIGSGEPDAQLVISAFSWLRNQSNVPSSSRSVNPIHQASIAG